MGYGRCSTPGETTTPVINEASAIIQVVPGVERAPSRVVNFERRNGSSGKLETVSKWWRKYYRDILSVLIRNFVFLSPLPLRSSK